MMWNARMRFMSSWAIAPSTPTTIVDPATHNRVVPSHSGVSNMSSWVRMIA